ncbi:MAG: hypothetical protein GC159_00865 [Phycisphaera sp.]|nr:hypothetical protein [Phycisphaera sp.]
MAEKRDSEPVIDPKVRRAWSQILGRIPQGLFVMTASYEGRMCGIMVSFVQQVSFEPPYVLVSLRKGMQIVPLIHESHAFGLSQIDPHDRLIVKKFSHDQVTDGDLLQAIDLKQRVTGAPVLMRAQTYMDCQLIRHIDIDGDHDLYVGQIREAGIVGEGEVAIHLRDDGFGY